MIRYPPLKGRTIDGTVISENTASGNGADQGGGGIYNLNGGTIIITNATISNNVADGTAGSGGGILNDTGSTLTITNTEITGNVSNRAGGGIEDNAGAMVTLTDVTLNNNTTNNSPGNGGGLHVTGAGTVNIPVSLSWRYILIPGGVAATAKKSNLDYSKMSYEEVCARLNIQP